MTACLDVGGLADCFIGYHKGRAPESILTTYADVRRDIFLKYVDARSIKNLNRCAKSDPWTIVDTDPFFKLIRELNEDEGGNKRRLKEFLMKVSSIEYDFTQHWAKENDDQAAAGVEVDDQRSAEEDAPMVEA
jgi:hypothetical protein